MHRSWRPCWRVSRIHSRRGTARVRPLDVESGGRTSDSAGMVSPSGGSRDRLEPRVAFQNPWYSSDRPASFLLLATFDGTFGLVCAALLKRNAPSKHVLGFLIRS